MSEGTSILPTVEQGLRCAYLCQFLTNAYISIQIVRLDERTGKLFILAGDDLEVVVNRDGNWE